MTSVAIDVRLMWASGIGSYVRNIVPRVMESFPDVHFYLMGVPDEMERLKAFHRGNAERIELKSKMFTIKEQIELAWKIPRGTDLFWSPHYVFPVLWRKKLLVTVHDTLHLTMGKQVPGLHRRFYARLMFFWLAAKADKVLAVSDFTRDELIAWTGINSSKIVVTHNGLDPSWFEVKRSVSPHPASYLLYVGIVKPHKNLSGLLEAYGLLEKKIKQDLVLVGKKEGFIVEDGKFSGKLKNSETASF